VKKQNFKVKVVKIRNWACESLDKDAVLEKEVADKEKENEDHVKFSWRSRHL